MSADNGIYILKTLAMEAEPEEPFEYRVAHASAIENIYWDHEKGGYREDERFTPEIAFQYFSEAPVFRTLYEASGYAHQLESDYSILEYGVSVLDHGNQLFESFTEEEIAAFEKKGDDLMEERRAERDRQIQEDLEKRTVKLDRHTFLDVVSGWVLVPSPEWDGDRPETQKMLRARLRGKVQVETLSEVEVIVEDESTAV